MISWRSSKDRRTLHATLIANQLPVEHWRKYIGKATAADAILDRFLHNAHCLPLKRESTQKKSKNA